MSPSFDVARDHRFSETRWFEDFQLGEKFWIPSRTQTDALFSAFQLASGDNDPIQTAAGAGIFPHMVSDSLVAMLECSAKFLGAVHAGDTLYPMLEITELVPQNTTGLIAMRATVHNQKSELVLEGLHRYLIRKRPKAI
jgi:acyl dehydratase